MTAVYLHFVIDQLIACTYHVRFTMKYISVKIYYYIKINNNNYSLSQECIYINPEVYKIFDQLNEKKKI